MTAVKRNEIAAGDLPTYPDEFTGRKFLGTGSTIKGTLVEARRIGGRGARGQGAPARIEVIYRAPRPGVYGDLTSTTYPYGATLRFIPED